MIADAARNPVSPSVSYCCHYRSYHGRLTFASQLHDIKFSICTCRFVSLSTCFRPRSASNDIYVHSSVSGSSQSVSAHHDSVKSRRSTSNELSRSGTCQSAQLRSRGSNTVAYCHSNSITRLSDVGAKAPETQVHGRQ